MKHGVNARLALTAAGVALVALAGCGSTPRSRTQAAIPAGWPLAQHRGVVVSSFGRRDNGSFHEGIDLAAPRGTRVVATADGVVVFARRASGYGRTVVIDHGGPWRTRYAHLKRIKVETGQRVARRTVIGTVGSSGRASGPHLHYEVLRHGVPVDPRPYLGDP